jgi:hypothetical protein
VINSINLVKDLLSEMKKDKEYEEFKEEELEETLK